MEKYICYINVTRYNHVSFMKLITYIIKFWVYLLTLFNFKYNILSQYHKYKKYNIISKLHVT